jgi:hypothetical protein
MIIKIDQSKPSNIVRSTTYFKNKVNTRLNIDQSGARSIYVGGNTVYKNRSPLASTSITEKNNYPGYTDFGIQSTTQNIYSADPQKLRIGTY